MLRGPGKQDGKDATIGAWAKVQHGDKNGVLRKGSQGALATGQVIMHWADQESGQGWAGAFFLLRFFSLSFIFFS